ncbi:hypothetical protein M8C21_003797, partial [Ambrosia artemisiifolia]
GVVEEDGWQEAQSEIDTRAHKSKNGHRERTKVQPPLLSAVSVRTQAFGEPIAEKRVKCRNHGTFVWKKKTGRWVPTLPRIVAMCGDEVVDALLMFLRWFRTTGMWLELLLRPDIDDSVWFRLHSRVFVCMNMSVDTNASERQCIHYLGLQRARTPPPPVGRK